MNLQLGLLLGIVVLFFFLSVYSSNEGFANPNEGFADPLPNENLIANVGGPAWGQFIVNPKLMPSKTVIGSEIKAGTTNPISIVSKDTGPYIANVTYRLGDVITYNGSSYICLAWTDARGPAFSGTYNASPDKDKNAWFKISIVKHLTSDPVNTEQSRELEAKYIDMLNSRSASDSVSVVSPYVRRTDISKPSDINTLFNENAADASLPGLPGLDGAVGSVSKEATSSELLDSTSPCLEGSDETREVRYSKSDKYGVKESKPAKCERARARATKCKMNSDRYKYYFNPEIDC
jgi:hypothetical protein